METKKLCTECGEPIHGRSDKKFCCDQCRNIFNNRLNSNLNNYMRNINNVLRKNRRILAELNPNGKTKIRKEKLLTEGFNFNYFTNMYRAKNGNLYYFCYDYGYISIENESYAVVKKREYIY